MLKKNLFKKVSVSLLMTSVLIFSNSIMAFADEHVPINITPNGHHCEVEPNDTEETANIVPFNNGHGYAEGRIDSVDDIDQYMFTADKTQELTLNFNQQCVIPANFFFSLYDVTGENVIYSDSFPKKPGNKSFSFDAIEGHTYRYATTLEGSEDDIVESLNYKYGCRYLVTIRAK